MKKIIFYMLLAEPWFAATRMYTRTDHLRDTWSNVSSDTKCPTGKDNVFSRFYFEYTLKKKSFPINHKENERTV